MPLWPSLPLGSHDCRDRKSTRLNSSHTVISYAVFCLKEKQEEFAAIPRTPTMNTLCGPAGELLLALVLSNQRTLTRMLWAATTLVPLLTSFVTPLQGE